MKRVFDILKKNEVITLATSSDDKPRASIVSQYVTEENSIIFGTDPNSIKGVNMQKNKRISASIFCEPAFASIDGYVTEPTEKETEDYKALLFAAHPEMKEYLEQSSPSQYYKIVPEMVYYADMSTGAMEAEIIKP